MIEAHQLTRRYGDFTAVQDMSFSVPSGQILGILGPNGAGKTTTIRMVTGFLPPSAGRVTLGGHDLHDAPRRARSKIGYLPEQVALYTEMRVHEYLRYRARLVGMGRSTIPGAIADALDRCLLSDVETQIIGTLSKGYRQRVGLAAAILHSPEVLVLDEPTVGLDPKQIIAIRELIRELGQERTLLLSTHILPEVEQLCHRVLIIDRGRLVADGTPAELRQQALGSAMLHVLIDDAPDTAGDQLEQIPGITRVSADPNEAGRFTLECGPGEDLRGTVFRAAVDHGWTLLELLERKASLEDVFVRLTTRAGLEDAHVVEGDTEDHGPEEDPVDEPPPMDDPSTGEGTR